MSPVDANQQDRLNQAWHVLGSGCYSLLERILGLDQAVLTQYSAAKAIPVLHSVLQVRVSFPW